MRIPTNYLAKYRQAYFHNLGLCLIANIRQAIIRLPSQTNDEGEIKDKTNIHPFKGYTACEG